MCCQSRDYRTVLSQYFYTETLEGLPTESRACMPARFYYKQPQNAKFRNATNRGTEGRDFG